MAKTAYCRQSAAEVDYQNNLVRIWDRRLRSNSQNCLVSRGWKSVRVNDDGQLLDSDGNPVADFETYVRELEASKANVKGAEDLVIPDLGDTDWDSNSKSLQNKHGMNDPNLVKKIQRRLNSLGFDAGSADGKFGPRTTNALKDFQNNAGLPATGIPDEKTVEYLLGE
ncbi:peptidoglycan-binding domain-containing protein [Gammaproteobacteria bacterium]|nr:peptidoglycan-binding domain-containing protein [Gammaproteobacteria bacterium]